MNIHRTDYCTSNVEDLSQELLIGSTCFWVVRQYAYLELIQSGTRAAFLAGNLYRSIFSIIHTDYLLTPGNPRPSKSASRLHNQTDYSALRLGFKYSSRSTPAARAAMSLSDFREDEARMLIQGDCALPAGGQVGGGGGNGGQYCIICKSPSPPRNDRKQCHTKVVVDSSPFSLFLHFTLYFCPLCRP